MRHVEYGDGEKRLVFVLGWGNRPEHDGVQWLLDHLTGAGYRVDAFEIPRTITDFRAEYFDPVAEHVAGLDSYRLLSHSTGGLISRYVEADDRLQTRTYLSPWWGFNEALDNPIVSMAMVLPVSTPILPVSSGDPRERLGALVAEDRISDLPDYAAPSFLREAKRAQREMPPFDDSDTVFYTSSDPVVGADAIERHAPAANRVQYDGGHELFNSRCRDEYVDRLLAAIERGRSALDD